jgi:hypothetical protein
LPDADALAQDDPEPDYMKFPAIREMLGQRRLRVGRARDHGRTARDQDDGKLYCHESSVKAQAATRPLKNILTAVPDKVLRPVLSTILVIVGVRMLRA